MTKPTKTLSDAIREPEMVFELAPVGLLVTRQRIIERCNRALAEMFGYPVAGLLGRSTEMLYPSQEEFEHIGERGAASMMQSGDYRDQRIMRHADGHMFWCAVSGRSFSPESPYASVIWVFDDLSDRRPVMAPLTAREREIAAQLISGLTSKQIARDLNLSHRTVEAHRLRLMRKLDVATTGELIARILGMPASP